MKVLFILGPTASGKSKIAFELAKKIKAPIINIDSVQVYQRLDIGSAKPTRSEFEAVPHFLFDICEPGEELTAGDFRRLAMAKLQELERGGQNWVICVGGSGFYFRALYRGMFDLPKVSTAEREIVEKKYGNLDASALYAHLKQIDPKSAGKISENDRYRLFRAVEVFELFGKSMVELQEDFTPEPFPYSHLVVGLERTREKLVKDIRSRTELMLHNGWIDEVKGLIDDGYSDWKALSSVGYREVVKYLNSGLTREELVEEIVASTRRLAKKQMTWFRKEKLHWINVDVGFSEAFNLVETLIKQEGSKG